MKSPGWLGKQLQQAAASVATWPAWMRNEVEEIPPLQIENFLTHEEAVDLRQTYAFRLKAGTIVPRGPAHQRDIMVKRVISDVLPLADRCIQLIQDRFPSVGPLDPEYLAYAQLQTNGRHGLHADSQKLDGSPNHTPFRKAVALIYLTEGGKDHEGGLLNLPHFNLTINPRPGLFVAFPSTTTYRHEVTKVTSGSREALTFWFQEKKSCLRPPKEPKS